MSFVTQALGHHGPAPGQRPIVYGQVTAPAPTSFNDPLYVVVPDWSTDFYYTCTHFPAIHGLTLPAVGNDVEVSFDNRHNPRCTWWDGLFGGFDVGA